MPVREAVNLYDDWTRPEVKTDNTQTKNIADDDGNKEAENRGGEIVVEVHVLVHVQLYMLHVPHILKARHLSFTSFIAHAQEVKYMCNRSVRLSLSLLS